MDKFDHRILAELERDGRQSFQELADVVGMSKTPCWNRVRQLQDAGVIAGYRALINARDLGLKLAAFCQARIDAEMRLAFEEAVIAHPAVIECHTIAGDADYLLRVLTSDVDRLDSLLRDEISRLPGVQRVTSIIGMKQIKGNGFLMAAASHR